MAEFVQQSIEEMLPELQQMERVGMFTESETRKVLRKRKAYEYKLRRRTKQKEDYLQYIEYENHVLALVRKRREKTGYSFKKTEIDAAIIQRIHKLFKLACQRFQDDVNLWLSHIEFCKKTNEKTYTTNLFTRMLQIHNKKPALWVLAAKWEMEEQLSMDTARSLLQRGLRFNPKSQQLWQEYFRMEVLNADKLRKRREILGLADMEKNGEEVSDAVLNGDIATIVFLKAVEAIPDTVAFHLSFLPIVQLFGFADNVQNKIFEYIEGHHPHNELTWEAVAQRTQQMAAQIMQRTDLSRKAKELEVEKHELEALSVFEKAVEALPTEKMWTLYVKYCLDKVKLKASQKTKERRIQRLLAVFEKAAESGQLSAELYSSWLEILRNTGQPTQCLRVSSLAVKHHPQSVTLWVERLHITASLNPHKSDAMLQELNKSLECVTEKESYPLWQYGLEWSLEHCPDQTEALLEQGILKCAEVAVLLKEYYLQWAALKHDIHRVRHLYRRLSASQPKSLEFFQKYIQLENAQSNPKMKKLRAAFEDAIREFGSSSPDLWLDYIKFEQNHPKGQPELVGQLHWRAIQTLDGALTETFVSQYTLLHTGH